MCVCADVHVCVCVYVCMCVCVYVCVCMYVCMHVDPPIVDHLQMCNSGDAGNAKSV